MKQIAVWLILVAFAGAVHATPVGQYRVMLTPGQIKASLPEADFSGLVDEQLDLGDPPSGEAITAWRVPSQHNKQFPVSATIDLGREMPLATLWIYDTNNSGDVVIKSGKPGASKEVAVYDCKRYKQWAARLLQRWHQAGCSPARTVESLLISGPASFLPCMLGHDVEETV